MQWNVTIIVTMDITRKDHLSHSKQSPNASDVNHHYDDEYKKASMNSLAA